MAKVAELMKKRQAAIHAIKWWNDLLKNGKEITDIKGALAHLKTSGEDVILTLPAAQNATPEEGVENNVLDDHMEIVHMCMECKGKLEALLPVTVAEPKLTPTNISTMECGAKLKPITLKDFYGNVLDWCEFRDQFVALVHSKDYDPHTKLAYLRDHAKVSLLEGQYSGNYEEIWKSVCDRYEDEWALFRANWTKMLAIKQAVNTRSSLLQLVDEYQRVIRGFKQLGNTMHPTCLAADFFGRMPTEIQLNWGSLHMGTSIPDVGDLINFVEQRVKILPQEEVAAARQYYPQVHVGTVPQSRCLCREDHDRFQYCQAFRNATVQQRIDFCKRQNMCLVCLYNHPGTCNRSSCARCNGPHHHWLCPRGDGRTGMQQGGHPQNIPRH